MTERLLDATEVAELLAVPVSWVREMTRAGRMPHKQLGSRPDVVAWLERSRS